MLNIEGVILYDTQEVATLLNINPMTLAKMRKKNLIASTKIGRKIYIPKKALINYLNGLEKLHQVESPEKAN